MIPRGPVLAVLAAACLTGAFTVTANAAAITTTAATVTGTVTDASTAAPVVGAQVCVFATPLACGITDSTGLYAFTAPAGKNQAWATANGYYDQPYGAPLGDSGDAGRTITLTAGQSFTANIGMLSNAQPALGITQTSSSWAHQSGSFRQMVWQYSYSAFAALPPTWGKDTMDVTVRDAAGYLLDSEQADATAGGGGTGMGSGSMYGTGNPVGCVAYSGSHRLALSHITITATLRSNPSVTKTKTVVPNAAACRPTLLTAHGEPFNTTRSGHRAWVGFTVTTRQPAAVDAAGVGYVYVNGKRVAAVRVGLGNRLYEVGVTKYLRIGRNSVRVHLVPATNKITAPKDASFTYLKRR